MNSKELIIQFHSRNVWTNCYTESYECSEKQNEEFKKLKKRFQFNNPSSTYRVVLRETTYKDEVIEF